jgi:hypothetical protein
VVVTTKGRAVVTFTECDPPATTAEIDTLQTKLGFPVPTGIRHLLLTANGGRPHPNVYSDEKGSTDVSECLALREGKGNIWRTYELMVLSKRAMPVYCLPFATDSGGNLFAVGCRPGNEEVHILLHDPVFRFRPLGVNLEGFWERLTELA